MTDYVLPQSGPVIKISGGSCDVSVSCTSDAATTARILREGFPIGSVHVPAGSPITEVTWHGSNVESLPVAPAYCEDGIAITHAVSANGIYSLPSAIAGLKFISPVTNVDGELHIHFER